MVRTANFQLKKLHFSMHASHSAVVCSPPPSPALGVIEGSPLEGVGVG